MAGDDVPVLIVGGSLVGLSAAVFLGRLGVPSLVLERHRGTAIHPRAALVNQRAIETYRVAGLQAEIEEAAAKEFVQNGAIVSVESLGGKELDWYFRFINEGVEHISPCRGSSSRRSGSSRCCSAQRRARRAHRVRVGGGRRSSRTTTASRRSSAPATAATSGRFARSTSSPPTARTARSASGSASRTSATAASRTASRSTSAPTCAALMGDRNLSVIYVFGPRLQGFFRFSLDLQAGFLVVNSTIDDDGTQVGADRRGHERADVHRVRPRGARRSGHRGRDRERAAVVGVRRVRGAARGRAGSSSPATRRTSCRRPAGSAATAGSRTRTTSRGSSRTCSTAARATELLSTYDAERSPVGAFTTEQAYTRYVLRLDPSLGTDNLQPIVDEAAVELGYRYRSSAIADAGGRRHVGEPARADGPAGLPRAARPDRRRTGLDARPVRARLRRGRRPRRREVARRRACGRRRERRRRRGALSRSRGRRCLRPRCRRCLARPPRRIRRVARERSRRPLRRTSRGELQRRRVSGMTQQQSQVSPRHDSRPSRAATPAITRAAPGSAHHQPAARSRADRRAAPSRDTRRSCSVPLRSPLPTSRAGRRPSASRARAAASSGR